MHDKIPKPLGIAEPILDDHDDQALQENRPAVDLLSCHDGGILVGVTLPDPAREPIVLMRADTGSDEGDGIGATLRNSKWISSSTLSRPQARSSSLASGAIPATFSGSNPVGKGRLLE